MKYIRTKQGQIIDTNNCLDSKERLGLLRFAKEHKKGGKQITIATKNIIKQASTIKELCDDLVIHNPNNDGYFFPKYFVYKNKWENILNENHAKHCINRKIYKYNVEIYGAIWITGKNGEPILKSVAKMNEKGELELI